MIKTDQQKKHRLETVSKNILEGLSMFNITNLTLNSDIEEDIDWPCL